MTQITWIFADFILISLNKGKFRTMYLLQEIPHSTLLRSE